MAKTFEWSELVPLGSEQAATADDHFRRLRLEVRERMSDIVTDWTADPVVLNPSLIAPVNDKKLMIHGSAFVLEAASAHNYSDTGLVVPSGSGPARAAVILPAGVLLKRVMWLINNADTAALAVRLASMSFTFGAAVTDHSSMNTVLSGTQILDSEALGPISMTISHDRCFFLSADKSGGAEFTIHGVELRYDTPDARNTL